MVRDLKPTLAALSIRAKCALGSLKAAFAANSLSRAYPQSEPMHGVGDVPAAM